MNSMKIIFEYHFTYIILKSLESYHLPNVDNAYDLFLSTFSDKDPSRRLLQPTKIEELFKKTKTTHIEMVGYTNAILSG